MKIKKNIIVFRFTSAAAQNAMLVGKVKHCITGQADICENNNHMAILAENTSTHENLNGTEI